MSTLTKPAAVLFDWDNTLVDTWPTIHRALNMTLDYMKHPLWTLEYVKATVKKSMRESFPEMFAERWEEAAKHYQQSYRSLHLEHLAPLPGAEEVLRLLRTHGIFTGVVSNKTGETLRMELPNIGWENYFDVAVGAGDAARDKPSADPALLALKNYAGARAEAVWFVGDTAVDLECAAAIGATAILYGDHMTESEMHDGHRFAAHVHDHVELNALLQNAIGATK